MGTRHHGIQGSVSVDPRTPVLVGAGTVQQRLGADGVEAAELMIEAVRRAAEDAGDHSLPSRANVIMVPRGTWGYRDPGRIIAERFSANSARTVVAQLGVLQQTLISRACTTISSGDVDVAIVCGGEARYREREASRAGTQAGEGTQTGVEPDELLVPEGEILAGLEIERGLAMPAHQYAVMENALRANEGQDLAAHALAVADLWASFSAVASGNPDAWNRQELTSSSLVENSSANRSIAFPYRRLHVSQWTVDQAAALIFTSAETAGFLGLDRDRWIFPLAAAESNFMIPLVQRDELHRCPGVKVAGEAAFALADLGPEDIAHVDLYSCFPVAVRIQARELGFESTNDRALTVTGGMTFAGGPLNNYVLQALAKMAEILRSDPGSVGLVTAISGMMTKQAVGLWSVRPPSGAFCSRDVSDEARGLTRTRLLARAPDGPAEIAGYTVLAVDGGSSLAVAIADLPDGGRTVALSNDASVAHAMTAEEWCFRPIRLGNGRFEPS
jgi:acetyl-CoA C-acetyltransferase